MRPVVCPIETTWKSLLLAPNHNYLQRHQKRKYLVHCVGLFVGVKVGMFVGLFVGVKVGMFVGLCEGAGVGGGVRHSTESVNVPTLCR